MRINELKVGDQFEFVGKHRGKIFRIEAKEKYFISYRDIATNDLRVTNHLRKTFLAEVELVTSKIVIKLDQEDYSLLVELLSESYKEACENNLQETKGKKINELFKKIRLYTLN